MWGQVETEVRSGEIKTTTTADAARLSSLTEAQVRHVARKGIVKPHRGSGNRYEFSFQDIIVLRRIKNMLDRSVPLAKILKGISAAHALSPVQPLSAINVQSLGSEIVIRDRQAIWNPETGQTLIDFDQEKEADKGKIQQFPVKEAGLRSLLRDLDHNLKKDNLTSQDWFNIGMELEAVKEPKRADRAYREAIRLDETNTNAYLNLGRLLQLDEKLPDAKRLYEKALQLSPSSELASYNLGTIFDTLEEYELAMEHYRNAPNMSAAHHNLSRIFEMLGDEVSAQQHLKKSKELEDQLHD